VIHHSDQGTQYASIASVGNAYDAMCESFFATL